MSLRLKTFLILLFAMALYGALGFCIQNWVILPSFRVLERDEAIEDFTRCTNAIQREVEYLNDLCHDWSAWDDLYAFVEDRNPTFEKANLVDNQFTESRVNLIYILNTAGQVVWGKVMDLESETFVDMEEFPNTPWSTTHSLLQHHAPTDSIAGILLTSRGPMLVASRPIATSASQGPLRGTLIMGRFLTQDRIQRIEDLVCTAVRVHPLQPGRVSAEAEAIMRRFTPESPCYIEASGASTLHVYGPMSGIFGDPALLVEVDVNRDIMAKGWTAVNTALASIVVSGFLSLGVVLLLLGTAVIRPIRLLTRHVTTISKGDDLTLAPVSPRNDEVGQLTREFNHMVRRIQNDNTDRRHAEEALRDSETRIRTLLEAAPDGIVTVDESCAIASLNPAAERLFGYEGSEILGRQLSELMPEWQAAGAGSGDGVIPPSGVEGIGRRKDGSTFPLHWTVGEAEIGGRRLYMGIVRDVTDLKQMHERVLRAEHLATIGEMGASVAHEVRNPLAGISGVIQVLRKKFDETDERRSLMDEILEHIARVDTIMSRLLLFAKLWEPKKQPVDLRALAMKVTREAQVQEMFQMAAFVMEDGAPVVASIDPGLVEQVLWNVLRNAAEAFPSNAAAGGPRTPEIRWQFSETGRVARILIEDTGPGMAQETVEKLFRPFFTTKTYGTGLGLTICQRIMESHGGAITVHSVLDRGTVVTLEFPKGV